MHPEATPRRAAQQENRMVLRRGDAGEAVKVLQRGLNKVGSLLLVDGRFGSAVGCAIADARTFLHTPGAAEADDALQQMLAVVPDPFPPLTCAGVTFIARAEVACGDQYRRRYCHPTWPSAKSGITIGIGYDLQFVDGIQFRADWDTYLPDLTVEQLVDACGGVGSKNRLTKVTDAIVPLPAAMSVFTTSTLPRFLAQTRSAYPSLESLTPARRTALVSLVYDRGPRLSDRDQVRQDRREMRAIRDLLAAGDQEAVADQFDDMARLWSPAELPDLIERRHNEARLWRSGFAPLLLD
jgi:hypothetical protein